MTRRHQLIHTATTGDIVLIASPEHDDGLHWEGVGIVSGAEVFYMLDGRIQTADMAHLVDAMKASHRPIGLFRLLDTIKLNGIKLTKNVLKRLFKSPVFWQTVINWSVRLIGKQPIYPAELKVAGVNLALIILTELRTSGDSPADLINSKMLVRLL